MFKSVFLEVCFLKGEKESQKKRKTYDQEASRKKRKKAMKMTQKGSKKVIF